MRIDLEKNGKLSLVDNEGRSLLFGDELSISYTLAEDDIRGSRLSATTPYESRRGELSLQKKIENGYVFSNRSLQTELAISLVDGVAYVDLRTDSRAFSEFGVNLPFNFMGKLCGGPFQKQYLFNSPYRSYDERYKYCYLTRVDGEHIFVLFLSPADGWKMDYSPWVGGHYFHNLKCLANFDRAYATGSRRRELRLAIFACDGFEAGLQKISTLLGVPVATYERSYSFDGKAVVQLYGECDEIRTLDGERLLNTQRVEGRQVCVDGIFGKTTILPCYQGKEGLDCSIFGYTDWQKAFEKSNDAIVCYEGENLGNLCECQFWASAMMRYMRMYGRKKSYDDRLRAFFAVLLPEKEEKAVARLSVMQAPTAGLPAYSVYKSQRIQEHFAGVSILLDAYKLYGEEKYLAYATGMLDSLIANYQDANGGFFTEHGGKKEDYSTVTCLMLAIVDTAVFLQEGKDARANVYLQSAKRLAEYVYTRGFSFPTEGGEDDCAEEQMEDGSISCSALTLLYYSAKIERVARYEKLAKEILDLHEAWVMRTPDANVFGSSLRWWETRWEGDKDGPALCCGHGWTIWRAEADFWTYELTGEKKYLYKSLNGFTTNFAKFDENGRGKAVYHMDYIGGGGFQLPKEKIRYEILPRFPKTEDVKTSRYCYVRAADTIFTLTKEELFQ